MREKITKVMRYSEPRMLFYHPILALHHVFDGKKTRATKKIGSLVSSSTNLKVF